MELPSCSEDHTSPHGKETPNTDPSAISPNFAFSSAHMIDDQSNNNFKTPINYQPLTPTLASNAASTHVMTESWKKGSPILLQPKAPPEGSESFYASLTDHVLDVLSKDASLDRKPLKKKKIDKSLPVFRTPETLSHLTSDICSLLTKILPIPFIQKASFDLLGDLPEHYATQVNQLVTFPEDSKLTLQKERSGAWGVWFLLPYDDPEVDCWFVEEKYVGEENTTKLDDENEGLLEWQKKYLWIDGEKMKETKHPVTFVRMQGGDCLVVPPHLMFQRHVKKEGILLHWNLVPLFTLPLCWDNLQTFTSRMTDPLHITHAVYYGLKKRVELIEAGVFNSDYLHELPLLMDCFASILTEEDVDLSLILKGGVSPLSKPVFGAELRVSVFLARGSTDLEVPPPQCTHCNARIFHRFFKCPSCSNQKNLFCLVCVAAIPTCSHQALYQLHQLRQDHELEFLVLRAKKAYVRLCGKHSKPAIWMKEILDPKRISYATIAVNRTLLAKNEVFENCHQCKRQKARKLVVCCTNRPVIKKLDEEAKHCAKKYCAQCLWNRHRVRILDCMRDPDWTCPSCRHLCNCALCVRQASKHKQ